MLAMAKGDFPLKRGSEVKVDDKSEIWGRVAMRSNIYIYIYSNVQKS